MDLQAGEPPARVAITFRALAPADLPVLCGWLNTPHVYEWWGVESGPGSLGGSGADAATLEQVTEKYGPDIRSPAPTTRRFVIVVDGRDVGLIQHYLLADFAEYAATIGETDPGTAGIDLFIAATDAVGRGLGARIIDAFTLDVVFADPRIARAVAGPHPDNHRSGRAFQKAGFVAVRDVVVPDEGPERIYARDRSA
jgi:RimJ/RimL family protein N-acetyltransferase